MTSSRDTVLRSRAQPSVRATRRRVHVARKGSVILVREQEGHLTGGGGCGCLPEDVLRSHTEAAFQARPAAVAAIQHLHRALRDRYGDAIEIQVVDPRNVVGLTYLLIRDFLRFRVNPMDALRTFGGLTAQAVVVDGRTVARGRWPSPDEVTDAMDARD